MLLRSSSEAAIAWTSPSRHKAEGALSPTRLGSANSAPAPGRGIEKLGAATAAADLDVFLLAAEDDGRQAAKPKSQDRKSARRGARLLGRFAGGERGEHGGAISCATWEVCFVRSLERWLGDASGCLPPSWICWTVG
ncbi:unnamed protein product [Ixodes pacificus]